ncbi:hypothetical protein [Rhodopirellula baltica]
MTQYTTVCQMTWSSNRSGVKGLVFSDELADDDGQAFGYWLPLRVRDLSLFDFGMLAFGLPDYQVRFPCTLRNEEIELATRMSSTELSFSISQFDETISFELNLALASLLVSETPPYFAHEKYVGEIDIPRDRLVFVEMLPVDIELMNEMFQEHRLVFVGQTKSFGTRLQSLIGDTSQ